MISSRRFVSTRTVVSACGGGAFFGAAAATGAFSGAFAGAGAGLLAAGAG